MASSTPPTPPADEAAVGMRVYTNPSAPALHGVVKQRFTDFIVNEVDKSGNVVHLLSTSAEDVNPAKKPKLEAEGDANNDASQTTADAPIAEVKQDPLEAGRAELDKLVGDTKATDFMTFFEQVKASTTPDRKIFMFPHIEDKAARTSIHKLVREYFSILQTDTAEDGSGAKCVRAYTASCHDAGPKGRKGRRGNKRGRSDDDSFDPRGSSASYWPADLPKYLEFTLCKENKDTLEALSVISKLSRVKANMFAYAGTKDKRGVTSQRVTAFKVKAEKMALMNKKLKGMQIGDYKYVDNHLQLGDLEGNRFTVVLRGVPEKEEDVAVAMKGLQSNGFVNFFGMQRFGTGSIPTHHVGRAILKGEWEEAVDLILRPRPGDREEVAEAREYWAKTKNVTGTLSVLPPQMYVERTVLEGLRKNGDRAFLNAIGGLPRNSRMIYIHAYQSYIFNNAVSKRIELFGCDKAVVGDLVFDDEAVQTTGEAPKNDAPEEESGNEPVTRGVDEASLLDTPNSRRHVKVLTEGDVGNYSVFDIVLPLPGYDVQFPPNVEGYIKELMAEDGVDLTQKGKTKEHNLSGSYRKLLERPRDLEWKLAHYEQVTQQLVPTDLDRLFGREIPEATDGSKAGLVMSFTLPPSTYATMCLREALKQSTSASHQTSLN